MRRLFIARLWVVAFAVASMVLPALCQPMDLRVVRDPAVEDYDFSWAYWFETQGQDYLREAIGQRQLPWDTPASRRWSGKAVDVLNDMLDDPNDGVRASAILALARIGHDPVLDRVLLPLDAPLQIEAGSKAGEDTGEQQSPVPIGLLFDRSDEVRLSSWAALGLLDTKRSRAVLAAQPLEDAEEIDIAAQAMAIGLMGALDRVHVIWLIARLDDTKQTAEVKRWCVWALRQHDDAKFDPVFEAALTNLPSTFVISEVLLHRGYAQRRGGAAWLADVLRYHPDVQGWAGYRALSALPVDGAFGSTPRRLAMETRLAATLSLAHQPIPEKGDDRREVLGQLRRRIIAGNSAQTMDFNRGFDTISYAMHCQAERDDLDLLYDQMRGMAILAADDPAVLEGLAEGEPPTAEDLVARQSANEVRGYTALAVGLLIRRATEGTELHRDRPIEGRRPIEIERLKRRFGVRLMRAIADEDEPIAYRAACALAIGLTGDARYQEELAIELGRLRGGDEAVLGYGLLALAMLGDDRVSEPARRYLLRPGKVVGTDDRLGRRAAMRALSILGERGGQATIEALSGTWGNDAWVSLSAAEATARVGRYDALPAIMDAAQDDSATWRRVAAISLGIIFDRQSPSRLAVLTEGANPTLSYRSAVVIQEFGEVRPDEQPINTQPTGWPMVELQSLSDPFLFYLLRDTSRR